MRLMGGHRLHRLVSTNKQLGGDLGFGFLLPRLRLLNHGSSRRIISPTSR